jgi:hypothetical protein
VASGGFNLHQSQATLDGNFQEDRHINLTELEGGKLILTYTTDGKNP